MTVESVAKSTYLVTYVVASGHREEEIVPPFLQELGVYAPREANLIQELYAEFLKNPSEIAYRPDWWDEITSLSFHLTQRLNHYARLRGQEFVLEERGEDGKCACVWGYRPALLREPCRHGT